MPDLATREKRIAYAAHQYSDQYPVASWERCERLGITSEEFTEGLYLHGQQEAEYRSWTRQYGKQEYGGWVRSPIDGRYKPHQVVEAETMDAEDHGEWIADMVFGL